MFRRFISVAVLTAIASPLWAQGTNSDIKAMPPTADDMRAVISRVEQLESKFKRYQENNDQLLTNTFRDVQRDMAELKDTLAAIRRDLDETRRSAPAVVRVPDA